MDWTTSRGASLLAIGAVMALCGCQTLHPHYAGPLILAPANCVDIDFPIYFDPGSATVTGEAEKIIAAARARAASCRVTGIDVVGLADAPGAADANYNLSRRRANAVARTLRRHGFTGVEFHEAAVGADNASTASGAQRPLRRRADVSVRLVSRAAAAGH